MTPARVLAAAVLALVLLASASVALAAGSGGAGRWQQHLRPHRAAPEPGERRGRHGRRVAAARVRGDDRARCGPRLHERGVAGSSPARAWGGHGARVLRRPRPGDGRRELPGAGRRSARAGHRRAVRDGGVGRRAGGDADGDPGRVPKQPAGTLDAWVEDCWHANYAQAPRDGTAWKRGWDCSRRVVRGGGWGRDRGPGQARLLGAANLAAVLAACQRPRRPSPTQSPSSAAASTPVIVGILAGYRRTAGFRPRFPRLGRGATPKRGCPFGL